MAKLWKTVILCVIQSSEPFRIDDLKLTAVGGGMEKKNVYFNISASQVIKKCKISKITHNLLW